MAEVSLAARLAAAKARAGISVSVCLPARDEEATVGHTIATVRRTLMQDDLPGRLDDGLRVQASAQRSTAEHTPP